LRRGFSLPAIDTLTRQFLGAACRGRLSLGTCPARIHPGRGIFFRGGDAALAFYRGALGEFEGFKDAYRNNVMHARKSYNEHEALALLNHVRDFMERLAAKIDETAKKQIRWGVK
jgi:hypothetical protein